MKQRSETITRHNVVPPPLALGTTYREPRSAYPVRGWSHQCGYCRSLCPVVTDGRDLRCARCGHW